MARPPTSLAFHMESSGPEDTGAVRDHGAKEASVIDAIRDASPALGLGPLVRVPSVMTPSTKLHMGADHPTFCGMLH